MQRPRTVLSGEFHPPVFLPALAICSVCFLAGGFCGCLLVSNSSEAICSGVAAYLQNFLHLAQRGDLAAPSPWLLLWEYIRWPAMVLLMAFTAIGSVAIPLAFVARGFFLAFALAAFVRILGASGCLLALLIFGLAEVFALPVFFLSGVYALLHIRHQIGFFSSGVSKTTMSYSRTPVLRQACLCAAAIAACVCLEYWAVPALVSALSAALPIL